MWSWACWIRDDLKLPGDGRGIFKSQGRGWQFESRLWNLLSTWRKNLPGGQLPHVLGVGLSAFCLKKEKQEPIGPSLLKNPFGARWGLLPPLQWVGSWLPTYLARFFFLFSFLWSSREKLSQWESNRQPLHLEMDTSPLSPGNLGSSQTCIHTIP